MNLLTVAVDVEIVYGVMMLVGILTYTMFTTRASILGIINLGLCIALAVEFANDRPDTEGVGLVMIAFVALGLVNGAYAVFSMIGKD